ncbi:hypothetical protein [Mycoplasmopsis synoviae]
MLANLTSLKDSLTSLQDLVSKGLAMQVDYPQKYYDADNKTAFDDALLKASSVFSAFKWTNESIMVPAPEEGALPNPRAWTKAREKSEFKLQNFLMAPATTQAATPSATEDTTPTAASAIVRVAMGEDSVEEGAASVAAQAPQAPATPDLASTASYLKTLETELKAQTAALNGDTTTNKTAYYKPVDGRTLYWDGFMPKIVLTDFDKTWGQNTANQTKIRDWFREASNWAGLSEQLTKKLGVERFKNVVLSQPNVTFEIINWNGQTWRVPTVTFNLAAKEGYELIGSTNTIALKIRVVYDSNDANAILFPIQGASSSAVPNRASNPNDATTIKNVNVYLNYTGPAIVLNADLPTVGGQDNTSINGTSNVTGAFNTAFRGNPSSGLLFTNRYANPLLKSVINYVNKFDPKYRAEFVTDSKNGVTITKVQNTKELRPGTLDDLNGNNVFLQQIKGDTKAVYFAVNGVANNRWLNTFLIRIPLTKFVRPLTEFQAQSATAPTEEASGDQVQADPQTTQMGTQAQS